MAEKLLQWHPAFQAVLQILVQNELPGQENIWLSRLRGDLNRDEDLEVLVREYRGRDRDPLYSAAMDLIVRANWNAYKEETNMCDALNELFDQLYGDKLEREVKREVEKVRREAESRLESKKAEVKAEGKAEGKAQAVVELLTERGQVSETLKERILSQRNHQVLLKWLKLAVRADGVEYFAAHMED